VRRVILITSRPLNYEENENVRVFSKRRSQNILIFSLLADRNKRPSDPLSSAVARRRAT
jgi:hypothetical protein